MSCTNIIEYFFEYVDYYITNNPGATFDDILDELTIFPVSNNFCCGSYGLTYIVGEANSSTIPFINNEGDRYNNIHILTSNLENFSNNITDFISWRDVSCVNNNFLNCITDFTNFLNSEIFTNYLYESGTGTGVLEYTNTYDNTPLFCQIADVLMQKSQSVALSYILTILQKGLVIRCDLDGTIVTSFDTYYDAYLTP